MTASRDGLTAKQLQVLTLIGQSVMTRGYVPTVREMCDLLSLSSPATVQNHVQALKTKGYLTGQDGMARTLSLTKKGEETLVATMAADGELVTPTDGSTPRFGHSLTSSGRSDSNAAQRFDDSRSVGEIVTLPVVGRVAAGTPILAEENVEESLALPSSLIKGGSFMLRVHGDSMINAGIFDGDLLIVHQQNTADDHDIVVALLDGEATVKTYYRERDQIRLQPENDSMAPIYAKDVEIAGKVVGLLRTRL